MLRRLRRRGRDLRRPARTQRRTAQHHLDGVDVDHRRLLPLRLRDHDRPALRLHDADRLRRRRAHRRVLDRLHGRRQGGAALLRLHGAVRLLDAPARPGRQPAAPARRLGHGRPLVVPADRVLARAAERDRCREEGVRHERDRRRDDGARALPADPEGGVGRVLRPRRRLQLDGRDPRCARPARRRGREVGAAAAADMAARRDGGPDAGQRAHPRGDDGDRRRLPDRAHALDLRVGPARRRSRRRARRGHPARRGPHRARPGRHQARDRVLDDVADRLHVPRRRPRRIRERDVPPDDARVLQGAAVHGRGHRHPRSRRRAGHPQDGRPSAADAPHVPGVPDRLARARRHLPVRRLLLEGPDPCGCAGQRCLRLRPLGRRPGRHVPHGPLHVPAALPRLLGRAEPVRARALPCAEA